MSTHWTARSIADYRYSVISSFLMQLERKMLDEDIQQKDLAERLGLTAGRVSQILNGKLDNFSVEKIVSYAQALDFDVAVVAYDNRNGELPRRPINPQIFALCWERQGKPQNFFDLQEEEPLKLSAPLAFWQDSTNAVTANQKNVVLRTDKFRPKIQQTEAKMLKAA